MDFSALLPHFSYAIVRTYVHVQVNEYTTFVADYDSLGKLSFLMHYFLARSICFKGGDFYAQSIILHLTSVEHRTAVYMYICPLLPCPLVFLCLHY